MTAVDVLGSVDELTDGTGGSVDARHGGENRSISEIPAKRVVPGDSGRAGLWDYAAGANQIGEGEVVTRR